MHVGIAELPAAELRGTPHRLDGRATGVDAVGNRTVELGVGRGQKARHRTGETVAIGVEGGHRHRTEPALGRTDDAVPVGRETLVGRQPVGQFIGQEGLPLLAAVAFPVGVKAVRTAGRSGDRESTAAEGAHRVAQRHPVAHVRGGVEGVEQHHRMRATALEGHRDVSAHRARRHHQVLHACRGGGRRRCAPPSQCHDRSTQHSEQFQQIAHTHLTSTRPDRPVVRLTTHRSESHPPACGSGIDGVHCAGLYGPVAGRPV